MKIHPERITQKNKLLVNNLNYERIKFPVSKHDFDKIEIKTNICINAFCYENKSTFPVPILDQTCENSMDLWHVSDENKSRYVYIKDFDRFMFNKNKKCFPKNCLQCFGSKNVLTEHKKVCFKINGKQAVKLEKGTVEFKNLFKQILVPFKIYSDFKGILNSVESYEGFYPKNANITFLVVLLTNLFVLMINFAN